jgi:hypothetical protein
MNNKKLILNLNNFENTLLISCNYEGNFEEKKISKLDVLFKSMEF